MNKGVADSMFQDKAPDDRRVILRDTCDKVENFTYEKSYTNQDVEVFMEKLSEVMIDISQIEGELIKIKKDYSIRLKPLKTDLKELIENIKFRSRMVEEQAFIFRDHDKNTVGYYSEEGLLIHSRPLKIDEHQRSIMSNMREEVIEPTPKKKSRRGHIADAVEVA